MTSTLDSDPYMTTYPPDEHVLQPSASTAMTLESATQPLGPTLPATPTPSDDFEIDP